ncbi:MAG: YnbE family lipoprotein [Nitrospirota bacterium]|nr:YnbE family lipoprotein [Nitrospirota bacterium]MDH5587036.1 YnbE family lipoprotein [Nitrospirota bacterium]MDH5775572.1 YnbE family lipoprotein [Nitrospirota bacterium]
MIRERRNHVGIHRLVPLITCLGIITLISCTPRVEVAAPEKPITINLNVKIDHEIRVKVEKDLDNVFTDKSGLF